MSRLLSSTIGRGIVLAGVLGSVACARFKIQELKPVVFFSVPVSLTGDEPATGRASIPAERNGRVLYNFPLRPYFNTSHVYLADPPRNLIRVFDTTAGTLEKMILSRKSPVPVPEDVERLPVEMNLPGWIAGDDTGSVYIQDFLPAEDEEPDNIPAPENREPGALMTLKRPPAPSVILQLDENSKPLYTLYEDPPERRPFQEILRMNGGKDGRLFVLHAMRDKKERRHKYLSEYRGGILVARYGNNAWATEDEQDDYLIDLEELVSENGGRYVLACVAFRERNSHQAAFRKIFRIEGRVMVSANQDEDEETPPPPAEEVLLTRNQGDFFGWVRPDGGFFLMHPEPDGSGVLYKIYDSTGEYINNQLIAFPGLRASWRDSYLTSAGKIYTTRLYRGKFEIYEWQ